MTKIQVDLLPSKKSESYQCQKLEKSDQEQDSMEWNSLECHPFRAIVSLRKEGKIWTISRHKLSRGDICQVDLVGSYSYITDYESGRGLFLQQDKYTNGQCDDVWSSMDFLHSNHHIAAYLHIKTEMEGDSWVPNDKTGVQEWHQVNFSDESL
ncbi:hypothetical protein TNCV_1495581 [Trichonephila clavipes]|nr:hypothetical protein TNCV_1495581 [Trichonephila clavipes]